MYFTVCSLFWGLDFYVLFATFFNVFLGNSKEVHTTAIKMAQKWLLLYFLVLSHNGQIGPVLSNILLSCLYVY